MIEYDFVTSLLADPVQIMEVTDVNPALLEDEGLRAVYDVVREHQGRLAPATLHTRVLKNPAGRAFLREFAAGQGLTDPQGVPDTRAAVDQLFRDGMSSGSASALADHIRSNALERTVNQVIGQTKPDQFTTTSDWAMALSNKINAAAAELGGAVDTTTLQDGVDEAISMWEFRLDNPNKVTGQRVGLGDYDIKMGGLQAGELIMIGGHTGEGKSQAMIHMALQAVQTPHDMTGQPARVAYFSLEMNQRQMSERFLAHLARVDLSARVDTGDERQRVRDAGAQIKQWNADGALNVVDPISVGSLDQICREMIRQKLVNNMSMAFVDYAQLINVSRESKYDAMADISRRFKAMALQLEVPVICGVQLNREALKETKAARPKFYHIADGLDLVRSADALHMIWTPGKHLGPAAGVWNGVAVLLTEKRRTGAPMPPLYYKADFKYSTLGKLPPELVQELCEDDAQDLLNRPRVAAAKSNGATA